MPSRLLAVLPLALVLSVCALGTARGQRLDDGESGFEKLRSRTSRLRSELFKGEVATDPRDKSHQEALAAAAMEVVWPIYWMSVKERPPAVNKVAAQVEYFENRLNMLHKNRDKGTSAAIQLFVKGVVERAPEVVRRGKPIASVNAARLLALIPDRPVERGLLQNEKGWLTEVLPRLTGDNAELLANSYVELLAEAKLNDGARYHLLRGLAHLLAVPPQSPELLKPKTREKAILTAMKLVEHKVTFPKTTPRDEIEGYKVLRREAVRAVAQARTPAIEQERPAWVLARMAGGDASVSPPPRLDERIEAALGLCRLAATTAKFPDFQADNAAFQVAHCVRDFAAAADENSESKAVFRQRPWRVDAARLLEGLDQLRAHKSPYVADAVKQCEAVLKEIELGRKGQPSALTDWLGQETNKERDRPLFRGAPATVVKRGAAADE